MTIQKTTPDDDSEDDPEDAIPSALANALSALLVVHPTVAVVVEEREAHLLGLCCARMVSGQSRQGRVQALGRERLEDGLH